MVLELPPSRSVARPVSNLGNTCYMNAVLQALAHAPELCMAMDCESHRAACRIAQENEEKRRRSPSTSPESSSPPLRTTRKTRRSHSKSSSRNASPRNSPDALQFCALCEVEQHLAEVHRRSSVSPKDQQALTNNNDAVSPASFVHGFIEHVAPCFRLGVQEDSHEFLRLLIDAMQKSCKESRVQENPQDTPPPGRETAESDDVEYPFQLFRGTVESNVTCESCQASSATLDPIEDIGLEVTPASTSSSSSSRASPTTTALADVTSAFQRFAKAEALDCGYKCDNCGRVGRATKQSRLASIPPILTLHLKRFRYGEPTKSTSVLRTGGREVSQLLGGTDFYAGKSGSAKIEGHIKFEQIFDLKPFLTQDLQDKHKSMFCRLFAVIVHRGKNSHSGHYIAYVRNLVKNEWWKMDDARVSVASFQEVSNAEAYMLFYRVVDHPIAVRLRNQAKSLREAAEAAAAAAAASSTVKVEPKAATVPIKEEETAAAEDNTVKTASEPLKPTSNRKRKPPEYPTGEAWAKAKTRLPPHLVSLLRKVDEFVSDNVELKNDYLKEIMKEANKPGAKVGNGPSVCVCDDDLVGGPDQLRGALLELLYELSKYHKEVSGDPFFSNDTATTAKTQSPNNNRLDQSLIGVVEADEGLL